MTKEEMKNKYSAFITEISETLGLGKPIDILKLCATTDLFFQPLENRITELEKACEETQELLDKQIEATYKLDKENAELKEFVNAPHTKGRKTTRADYIKAVWDLSKQLTKAKELLERFLGLGNLWDLDCKDYFPLRKEAEQFLKDCEVEK